MEYNFEIENMKCGGCINTITTKLREIDGVQDVIVNVDDHEVTVISEAVGETNFRSNIAKELARLGYPEAGSASSNSVITKATSFVSCALGKVTGKR
jgi:copper chaperone CopZ